MNTRILDSDELINEIAEVLREGDGDFNVHPETDHADIVATEIMGYEVTNSRDDTILL